MKKIFLYICVFLPLFGAKKRTKDEIAFYSIMRPSPIPPYKTPFYKGSNVLPHTYINKNDSLKDLLSIAQIDENNKLFDSHVTKENAIAIITKNSTADSATKTIIGKYIIDAQQEFNNNDPTKPRTSAEKWDDFYKKIDELRDYIRSK